MTHPLAFHVVTLQPDFVGAYTAFGVLRAAIDKGAASIAPIGLRQFAVDKHGTVDGPPYGGGDGMVLRPDVLKAALDTIPTPRKVIIPSPAGKRFDHAAACRLAEEAADPERPVNFVFICGRFGGIDQRFLDAYADEEISLGDFVVSGGELPALVIMDAILRQIPGVLGHADSAACDSFGSVWNGGLEHPLYTRPPTFEGREVPPVLLSGDHARIESWKQEQALRITREKRPDLDSNQS